MNRISTDEVKHALFATGPAESNHGSRAPSPLSADGSDTKRLKYKRTLNMGNATTENVGKNETI